MQHDNRPTSQILSISRTELGSDVYTDRLLAFQAWLLVQPSEKIGPMEFLAYAAVCTQKGTLRELRKSMTVKMGNDFALIKPLKIAISDVKRRNEGKKLVTEILAAPWWKPFLDEPKLLDLKPHEIERLDQFLFWMHSHGITSPCENDYLIYSESFRTEDSLKRLLWAFRKLGVPKIPQIEKEIAAAISKKAVAYQGYQHSPRTQWSRTLSVKREDLPADWGKCLAVLRAGKSPTSFECPPKSVVQVMGELLCAYAFFCEKNSLDTNFETKTMITYVRELKSRGVKASTRTLRVSKLHYFTRYLPGAKVDNEALRSLAAEQRLEAKGNTSQKFTNRKLQSYQEPLTKAVELLGKAKGESLPKVRSKYLRHAMALSLFTFVPLRSSDTNLLFGENISFFDTQYFISVKTSKTGERIHAPLCHFLTPFFNALILQGCDERFLPALREKAIKEQQPLFSFECSQRRSPRCVANIWRSHFRCGPHFARTLLHEKLGQFGPKGLEQALLLCAQRDPRTAAFYRGKSAYDAKMLLSQEILYEEFSARELSEFAPNLDKVY